GAGLDALEPGRDPTPGGVDPRPTVVELLDHVTVSEVPVRVLRHVPGGDRDRLGLDRVQLADDAVQQPARESGVGGDLDVLGRTDRGTLVLDQLQLPLRAPRAGRVDLRVLLGRYLAGRVEDTLNVLLRDPGVGGVDLGRLRQRDLLRRGRHTVNVVLRALRALRVDLRLHFQGSGLDHRGDEQPEVAFA